MISVNPVIGITPSFKLTVHVRWMLRHDLPAVLLIEQGSHEFPWEKRDFMRCLRHRNCIALVAERDDMILGYMVYRLYTDYTEIANFAVHVSYRRLGVGSQLMRKIISGKLTVQGRRRVILAGPVGRGARLFMQSCGFQEITPPAGRPDGGEEEHAVMEYRLATADTTESTDLTRRPT